MHANEISGMLKALKPAIKSQRKARQILEKYWQSKIALVWTVDEVHRAANERDLALTAIDARQILQRFFTSHNKQYGLQWSDLIELILDSGLEKNMTRREINAFVNRDVVTVEKVKSP